MHSIGRRSVCTKFKQTFMVLTEYWASHGSRARYVEFDSGDLHKRIFTTFRSDTVSLRQEKYST